MSEMTISAERYEQLLRNETRVNVAVEQIISQKYIKTEDILRILGTEDALLEAARLHEEEEREKKEWKEKHEFS